MYRLYWDTHTGSIAPEVMFEEMGLPWEPVRVDLDAGEHREPAYLAINPAGQVPALQLSDGTVVTESAAIVLLLGERHPEGGLVPSNDDPARPAFLRWLLFLATSVYPSMLRVHHTERFTTDTGGIGAVRDAALDALSQQFALLDDAATGDPWFLPGGYCALDIYLAMLVDWHPRPGEILEANPALARVCHATEQRPAFARVMQRHRG